MKQTPEQLIRYGHIATALRNYLKEHNMGVKDLNIALGLGKTAPQAYQWINGKSAPGAKVRPKLAKLIGIAEEDLKMRLSTAIAVVPPPKPQNSSNSASFVINDNDEATIKLTATLPIKLATPLFQIIMDSAFQKETK